jgi:DNA repair protein RAD5
MDIDDRPVKRRRFFTDESPNRHGDLLSESVSPPLTRDAEIPATTYPTIDRPLSTPAKDAFDVVGFKNVVGAEVPPEVIAILHKRYGANLEPAINAYFDGSWKDAVDLPVRRPSPTSTHTSKQQKLVLGRHESSATENDEQAALRSRRTSLASIPKTRYIGSLGVTGWATCSGLALLKPGDPVTIERHRQQIVQKSGRGGRMMDQIRRTQDVIVRFRNGAGKEIGRLEKETAIWVSALIDQDVCQFDGRCIYASERIRTNDTIYIQLRCFLLRSVFSSSSLVKPLDNNRETGLYEMRETNEERDLRLRQVGLVKLFSEINLHPSKSNELTAKHKREGILQAAEHFEQASEAKESRPSSDNDDGSSSPTNEEGEELEQDQLDSLYKKAQSFDFNTPEATPAKTFAMDLRKYQKQALHWMLNKEKRENDEDRQQGQSMHPLWEEYSWPAKDADDKELPVIAGQECFYVNPYSGEMSLDFPVQEQTCLGGVLADEMGLGKTIQMLSLVHSHRSPEHLAALDAVGSNEKDPASSLTRQPPSTPTLKRALATTLVVAPMSLLAQWASEAEKASKPGTIRVLIYYGSEKGVNLQTLCCGSNLLAAPNVIITSYGVVLSEFNSLTSTFGGNRTTSSGLFGLEYWRIILDEAHTIKNRQSKTAKACYELAALHRWVLTGTPIVNRLEDLFSLVRFLRVEPWSNFSFWKTFITVPFEKGEFMRALDVVQTVLEPLVMRRTKDMKTPDGEALVALPPRTIAIEKVKLSAPEQDVYDHIFLRAKRAFAANVEAGTVMKSYTTIFAQILRLRQTCCHPILTRNKNIVADEEDAAAAADIANGLADDMDLGALIERFAAEEGDQDASKFGAHVLKQIQDGADMECPICAEEPMEEHAVTGCWHSACKKCLLDYIEHETNKGELARCFNCREPINARDVFEVIRHDEEDVMMDDPDEELSRNTQAINQTKDKPRISLRRVNQLSSAKIGTLLTHLKNVRKVAPVAKSVVFSQFTSFLDLVDPALKAARINTLRFDGTMSQKERARVLKEFATRSTFTVLLLSLRAGGVGLNLTCASRVYMMDPWWSFAIEAQAIDRVHRMGQTEEVHVIRFIVEGSIEEKMLKVQDRKKFM